MERLLAVGVGCAVGCASLALLSPGEKDRRGAGWHVRRVSRHVRATLRRLGATAWAALALEWRPVRSLVDELAGRESLRSLGLSPRELAAALGMALPPSFSPCCSPRPSPVSWGPAWRSPPCPPATLRPGGGVSAR